MTIRNWFGIRKFEGEKPVEEKFDEIPEKEWEEILKLIPVDGEEPWDEPNEFEDGEFFKNISADGVELTFEDGYEAGFKEGQKALAEELKSAMEIEKVIHNGPATIILWADKSKTTARAEGEDTPNHSAGIGIAMAKKMVGNAEFRKVLEEWDDSLPGNEHWVELED